MTLAEIENYVQNSLPIFFFLIKTLKKKNNRKFHPKSRRKSRGIHPEEETRVNREMENLIILLSNNLELREFDLVLKSF